MWSGRVCEGVVVCVFILPRVLFFWGGGGGVLYMDKESLSEKRNFFFFSCYFFFGGGGVGGGLVYVHEQMFQMTLLLFKENTCAKLF